MLLKQRKEKNMDFIEHLSSECKDIFQQYSRIKTYEKNETIYSMQDIPQEIGIVLQGSVNIETVDYLGNVRILSHIEPHQIFAESYALSHTPMLVYAVASQDSTIQFLHIDALNHCAKLQARLLQISAKKNIYLSQRIFLTSTKSIRTRVLSYLSFEAKKAKTLSFEIPFDRQQMANYLNVDRSALSKELSNMKKEGLLDYHKNKFTLKKPQI